MNKLSKSLSIATVYVVFICIVNWYGNQFLPVWIWTLQETVNCLSSGTDACTHDSLSTLQFFMKKLQIEFLKPVPLGQIYASKPM